MPEITRLSKHGGPLTKRIALGEDGQLISDGSHCVMATGTAQRVRLGDPYRFADLIQSLNQGEAIALGSLRPDLPEVVKITTKRRLDGPNEPVPVDVIARTGDYISYRPGVAAWAMLDIDTKGMPPAVRARIEELGGFWPALVSVLPGLEAAARVVRTSTSSGLSRNDTGEHIPGSEGQHIYVLVDDGTRIEHFLRTFHDRCWLAGLGWQMVGAGGQLLNRSLIDRMVFAPERLVFEGAPILVEPLTQALRLRAPQVFDGIPINIDCVCPSLSVAESARLGTKIAAEAGRLRSRVGVAQAVFVAQHAAAIAERAGISEQAAREVARQQCEGRLLPDVALAFDDPEFDGCTVGNILADPDRFIGATLADPLEDVAYGRGKAKVLRDVAGDLLIHSFAHGRTVHHLMHDARSIDAAIKAADEQTDPCAIIDMYLAANINEGEAQRLRDLIQIKTGIKAAPLKAQIKAARADHDAKRAEAKRKQQAADRTDTRVQSEAPHPDAERLPTMKLLDGVLSEVDSPEPPFRDLDGRPTEVRCRQPHDVHTLTAEGSNGLETATTRLPPPVLPLLTFHDRFSLAHEIERHIEFTGETKEGDMRAIALPQVFVDHYEKYRHSTLPRIGGILTAPLVLQGGQLLATPGIDRERGLIFRIEPGLLAQMPDQFSCTPGLVKNAMRFLTDEWLCDVATDYAGKCELLAFALSIIERAVLPERPAFFVTAGRRGGGKTTVLSMLVAAATGRVPAAQGWSSSEEERRKAIFANLSEGLPALVWDNIPLGTTISCPTLEKVLTSQTLCDRKLGETLNLTVPCTTIMSFTGNNISPSGDMSSRSLVVRIDVSRPDPENRKFRHPDPIGWTLDNRGKILKALYVLLLGNPQLTAADSAHPKTRFKTWWVLVGSAVEHAAWLSGSPLDFQEQFAAAEAQDQTADGLGDTLDILQRRWCTNGGYFKATDVASLINNPNGGEEGMAAVLREFLAPDARKGRDVSSKSVGRRLVSMVGAPTWVGEQTLKLIGGVPSRRWWNRLVA